MIQDQIVQKITVTKKNAVFYIRLTGKLERDDSKEFDQVIGDIEKDNEGKHFILDLALLEDFVPLSMRPLILLQTAARKRGILFVIAPKPIIKERLIQAGGIRPSETYNDLAKLAEALKRAKTK